MRSNCLAFILIWVTLPAFSQKKNMLINGMYLQWGYNTEWYTKSTIHFKMSNGNNFKLHHAKAHDKPDLDAIYKEPDQVSIPQYNYRIGFYVNKKHTTAIELNFDHAKYVVTDGQQVHVTGTIDGKQVDGDSILNRDSFLHFEHTDGANWLHINYVSQKTLFTTYKKGRPLLNYIWKLGAGINIPRTDFTWKGERLNNNFHVAGYNLGAEGGVRFYPLKKFFIEGTGKTGYVRYINALACTPTQKGNRATHGFGYFELIGLIGYDIYF
jgi:hypothetical protein